MKNGSHIRLVLYHISDPPKGSIQRLSVPFARGASELRHCEPEHDFNTERGVVDADLSVKVKKRFQLTLLLHSHTLDCLFVCFFVPPGIT